jgi:thiamine pyrophosphate-dependent acetolactate synthase large subunit-like protein
MADGYSRVSGRVGVCSVHQGPGFTNAMTGLTEAAKSRTPLLLLAGEAPAAALRSNFRLDQAAVATTVGAAAERVHSGATAAEDTARAFRRAEVERRHGAEVHHFRPQGHPVELVQFPDTTSRRSPRPPARGG